MNRRHLPLPESGVMGWLQWELIYVDWRCGGQWRGRGDGGPPSPSSPPPSVAGQGSCVCRSVASTGSGVGAAHMSPHSKACVLPTHGRIGVFGDLHQIQPLLPRQLQRRGGVHHAQIGAIGADYTHAGCSYSLFRARTALRVRVGCSTRAAPWWGPGEPRHVPRPQLTGVSGGARYCPELMHMIDKSCCSTKLYRG